MHVYPFRGRCVFGFIFLLFVELAISGCHDKPGAIPTVVAYSCPTDPSKPIEIKVDHTLVSEKGVHPKAIILCDKYKIEWIKASGVKDFEIEFEDSPWPGTTKFGTLTGESTTTPVYSAPADLTVYKYKATIYDSHNGKHEFPDPHVVGGGGIAISSEAR
jgi:hypothetical protein